MQATFATNPAFLVTAKRRRRIKFVERIRPDHARANILRHFENLGALVRPHASGQSIRCVVRLNDRFIQSPEGLNGEDRAKYFFLNNATRLRYAGKDGRPTPVSLSGDLRRALVHLAALLLPDFQVGLDPFQLRRRINCTDIRVFVHWITNDQRFHPVFELLHNLVRHGFLHQQS